MSYTQDEPTELPPSTIIIGDTWRLDLVLEDFDEDTRTATPFDLTGVTGVAKVVTEPGGAVIATPTVTIDDAAAGEFSLEIDAATTAVLDPDSELRFGVRLTWLTGEVYTVARGPVVMQRGEV